MISQAAEASFPLLRFVAPYGDTVFNRLQAAELVTELHRFEALLGADERGFLRAAIQLAEHCAASPHHYLRFEGD